MFTYNDSKPVVEDILRFLSSWKAASYMQDLGRGTKTYN